MSGGTEIIEGCSACAVVNGSRLPRGGVVRRGTHFVLHSLDGPSPIKGWMVLTSVAHVRAWYGLEGPALSLLGPAAAAVMNAQRAVLGAEHVYAMAIGDVLQHCHLHLVPRYADTPQRLRGRGAFDAAPDEACSEQVLETASRALGEALATLVL